MTQTAASIRISVVIPAYNRQRWLGRAIDSVLSQERPADEIIVVDDGSTDGTGQVASGYGKRIRYIRQDNAGPSAARNAGIAAATGNWIAFLDADDQWLPHKLRLQTEHLCRHPELLWTTGNYIECLCQSDYKAPALTEERCRKTLGSGQILDDYLRTFAAGFTGNTDTMLIRRDLLEEAGGFPVDQRRFEDLDLWLKIAYRHPQVGFLSTPLAIYHLEAGEHISVECEGAKTAVDLIGRHLKLAAELGRLEAFRPLAAVQLKRWMRGMLFDRRQAGQIRRILEEFPDLLAFRVRCSYYLLTIFPSVTSVGCHTLSKIVRLFGLRRRAIRKPVPQNHNLRK
jgi:glycosyltransferase involved in cell wall biosynthesis